MNKLLTAFLSLIALSAAVPAAAHAAPGKAAGGACAGADSSTGSAAAQVSAMRCLVNTARRGAGLHALASNGKLTRAAGLKGGRIEACRTFSHTPCGAPFTAAFRAAGWRGTMGENIAFGQAAQGTPRAILNSWLQSPGHRANLLHRSFRVHGLAVRSANLPGVGTVRLWVHAFGA
ncbi:MAG TPA: CAP domain-containing protein [Solirubrobacteraceae bacterium]|jgi:uncharacterized protein YkwD|nr:CAP domain-containing protein [Solirubrobacteraceae bacterium]